MHTWLARIPLGGIVLVCLTLGLAPFRPPHVWEKLTWLVRFELTRPIDWLDLLLHGAPWAVLILKLVSLGPRAKDGEA